MRRNKNAARASHPSRIVMMFPLAVSPIGGVTNDPMTDDQ
jgi:hypothetical protein